MKEASTQKQKKIEKGRGKKMANTNQQKSGSNDYLSDHNKRKYTISTDEKIISLEVKHNIHHVLLT